MFKILKKIVPVAIILALLVSTPVELTLSSINNKTPETSLSFLAPTSLFKDIPETYREFFSKCKGKKFERIQKENPHICWVSPAKRKGPHETWRGIDHQQAVLQTLASPDFLKETLTNIYPQLVGDFKPIFQNGDWIKIAKAIYILEDQRGSQKQTYHIFVDFKGISVQFALKIAINRASREGFRPQELENLKKLRASGRVARFGVSMDSTYTDKNNSQEVLFHIYSEQWVHGRSLATMKKHSWLDYENLSKVVSVWLIIGKFLGQSKKGNWIIPEDMQAQNIMLFFSKGQVLGVPTVIDLGRVSAQSPLQIMTEIYKHYGNLIPRENTGDTEEVYQKESAKALFRGILEGLGFFDGFRFLYEVYERTSSKREKPVYYQALKEMIAELTVESTVVIDKSPFTNMHLKAHLQEAA